MKKPTFLSRNVNQNNHLNQTRLKQGQLNAYLFIVIYFLLPNSSPWINLAELNTLEMVDASSKKTLSLILSWHYSCKVLYVDQTSYCFETRADHKTGKRRITVNKRENKDLILPLFFFFSFFSFYMTETPLLTYNLSELEVKN